jgi:phosphate transport system substrate-binding protein
MKVLGLKFATPSSRPRRKSSGMLRNPEAKKSGNPKQMERLKTPRSIVIKLFTVALVLLTAQLIHASTDTQSRTAKSELRQSVFPLVDSQLGDPTENRPEISIILDGTDEGIRSLLDQECEVAMASRRIRKEEEREAEARGLDIREMEIGGIGIAVAVHPTNPVDELTVDQVREIFDGTLTAWKQVGGEHQPISIVTLRAPGSRISGYLTQATRGAPMRQIASQEKDSLGGPNEVALVHVGNMELQPNVKLLAIKRSEKTPGFLPSQGNVNNGLYPFVQPLYLYIDWKHSTDQAKAFFRFCAAERGNTRNK